MKIALSAIAVLLIVAAIFCFHHRRPPSFTGIGVAVAVRNHSLVIIHLVPNTPATRAGLVEGLIIQRIDDASTDGKSLNECVDVMRGPVGSRIQLELYDPAKKTTHTVEFTREIISLPVTTGTRP